VFRSPSRDSIGQTSEGLGQHGERRATGRYSRSLESGKYADMKSDRYGFRTSLPNAPDSEPGPSSDAEEMRAQMLAFDCVAEVLVLDEPGWVGL